MPLISMPINPWNDDCLCLGWQNGFVEAGLGILLNSASGVLKKHLRGICYGQDENYRQLYECG